MESISTFFADVIKAALDILQHPIFYIGKTKFDLTLALYLFIITVIVMVFATRVKKLVADTILGKTSLEYGARQAVGSLVRYSFIVLGLFIAFQAAGIDLSALTVVLGALSVGLGFGLQNITNNFISGIILLVERPIKIGDRVQVGEIDGDVVDISIRATTIITNDNIAIIVPNSEFVSSTVINWSHNDRHIRFRIKTKAALHSDPRTVEKALLEAAAEYPGALKEPIPVVIFDSYGEHSQNYWLWVWTEEYVNKPSVFRSEMNFVIHEKLKKYGVEVPLPQREIRLLNDDFSGKTNRETS